MPGRGAVARTYFVFRSTHETLRAEAVLQGAGVPCKVVLKPAAIHLDCGLAVRTPPEAQAAASAALAGAGLAPRGVFTL